MSDAERHAWIGFDGSYHCYGCGITVHVEPPEFGCDPIGVRARRVAESPMRYGRRHISALLLEAADRLDAQAKANSETQATEAIR